MSIALEIERFKDAVSKRVGKLSELETTNKADLVSAINEVKNNNSILNNSGGGANITTIEQDLGIPAKNGGYFQITGLSGLTIGKQVIITQAAGPYTGKGTLADEALEPVFAKGIVTATDTIDVYWTCPAPISGNIKFNYIIQ